MIDDISYFRVDDILGVKKCLENLLPKVLNSLLVIHVHKNLQVSTVAPGGLQI